MWNRPQSGINEITAIIDERDNIKEDDEENNTYEGLTPEMHVRLPQLVVESVETDPPSGTAQFGDTLFSTVRLKNNGEAPINLGFKTALFVNDKQVGSFTTPTGLKQGDTATGTISWKGDVLPTDPYYRLAVFADVDGAISVANRVYASFNTVYQVKGALQIDAWSERETYTVAEKPAFNLLVRSTDKPWMPLGPEDGVLAGVHAYVYGNIVDGVPVDAPLWEGIMEHDPVTGRFIGDISLGTVVGGLNPGSYYAYIKVDRGEEVKTAAIPFKLVPDYSVTVGIAKEFLMWMSQ